MKTIVKGFPIITIIGSLYFLLAPLEAFLVGYGGSFLKYLALVYVVMLVLVLLEKSYKIRVDEFDLSLLLFTFVLFCSLLWSYEPTRGLNYVNSIGLQVVLILIMRQIPFRKRHIDLFVYSYIVGTIVLSVLTVINKDLYGVYIIRYTASIGDVSIDPNNLAALVVSGLALLISLDVRQKTLKAFKIVLLLLMFTALLLTGSRGGILSSLVVILFAIFLQKKDSKDKWRIAAIIITIAFIIVLLEFGFHYFNLIENLMFRFQDRTGSGRTEVWKLALDIVSQRPILGYGVGSSPIVIFMNYGSRIGSHNTFLTVLIEVGILGLLPFISFIYFALIKTSKQPLAHSLQASLISVLVSMSFFDVYNKKVFWSVLLLAALERRREE